MKRGCPDVRYVVLLDDHCKFTDNELCPIIGNNRCGHTKSAEYVVQAVDCSSRGGLLERACLHPLCMGINYDQNHNGFF